jgi:hypothetical protein
MFRKRKSPAPFFRMNAPYNPVAGDTHYLYPEKNPYTRFTLTEQLTTADPVKDAEITEPDQWGPAPIYHCPKLVIHVHNQETKIPGTYQFSGEIGDVGIALWDQNHEWRIIAMFTPGLRGCCLEEDHPGRGEVFDITLGVWSPDDHKWLYTGDSAKAIDWRYDVPYPTGHATGLFEARPSTTYGVIWEVVALDCASPGECGE